MTGVRLFHHVPDSRLTGVSATVIQERQINDLRNDRMPEPAAIVAYTGYRVKTKTRHIKENLYE
ncbi:MAG: hypothetical protein CVU70_00380 [Deltaproteobacteria bacterium HGW-Deltaproteobacteria-5]|nr:MAG: hypothetical protein CVU70_00380 [Deltaproteobacteria bacterium HGW-Deltaproteobacteria-5]